jgi:hypothetical protein
MAGRRIKPTDKVPINEPSPIVGRIAWHIENTLVRFMKRIFNELADGAKNVISFAIEETIDVIEDGVLAMGGPMLDEVLKTKGVPNWIKGPIIEARKGQDVAAVALIIPIVIALLVAVVMAVAGPFTRRIQYEIEQVVETYRPSPETLVQMMHRGNLDRNWFQSYVTELGVSTELEQTYIDLVANRLPDNAWGNAFLRGDLSEGQLREEMAKRAMPTQDIDIMIKLLQIIPGPQDLIRMAVREAWNDRTASTFGYDQDFPSEFGEWAERIGLSAEWAKRFWRAHWELPGVREGFEMLHRRIITEDELNILLQARDIPAFWRTRLVQLSYNPYTRVDVRRMFALGVVSVDEVYNNYRDIGYDDEHARKLTEWTIEEYGDTGRELTKGDVIASYTDNIINESQAIGMLDALGYVEAEILILLARADLKRQAKYEKELTETVRIAYVGKRIEEDNVFAQLSALNPPAGFIEERLTIWRLQRERNLTRPSKADLKKLWIFGIIDENLLKREMRGRNYTDEYTEWYIQLWTLEAGSS